MSDQLSVRVYGRGLHPTGIQRRERKRQMGIMKEGFEGWKPMNWWRASQSGTRAEAKPRDGNGRQTPWDRKQRSLTESARVRLEAVKGEPCCMTRGDGGQLDHWANGAASWALLRAPASGRCDEIGDLGRLVWQWCVEWTGGWRGWVKEILFAVYVVFRDWFINQKWPRVYLGGWAECVHMCYVASVVSDSATQWTVACQVLLSMGLSRQEYWSGLPCPSPGDLSNPRIKPESPALQADSFTHWATWKLPCAPVKTIICHMDEKLFFEIICSHHLTFFSEIVTSFPKSFPSDDTH